MLNALHSACKTLYFLQIYRYVNIQNHGNVVSSCVNTWQIVSVVTIKNISFFGCSKLVGAEVHPSGWAWA